MVKIIFNIFLFISILSLLNCAEVEKEPLINSTFLDPLDIAIDPSGKFALVVNANYNRVLNSYGFVSIICTSPYELGFNKVAYLGEELTIYPFAGEIEISNNGIGYIADRFNDSLQKIDLSDEVKEKIIKKCASEIDNNKSVEELAELRKDYIPYQGIPPYLGEIPLPNKNLKEENKEGIGEQLPLGLTLDPLKNLLYIAKLGSYSEDNEKLSGVSIYNLNNKKIESSFKTDLGINSVTKSVEIECEEGVKRNFIFASNEYYGEILILELDGINLKKISSIKTGVKGQQNPSSVREIIALTPSNSNYPLIYAAVRNPDSLYIIDPKLVCKNPDDSVIDIISVGASPGGITASYDGKYLFVSNYQSNDIYVIDSYLHEVIDIIPTDKGPYNLAITPDGKFLYCANFLSNSISVIYIPKGKVIKRIPSPSEIILYPKFSSIDIRVGETKELYFTGIIKQNLEKLNLNYFDVIIEKGNLTFKSLSIDKAKEYVNLTQIDFHITLEGKFQGNDSVTIVLSLEDRPNIAESITKQVTIR